MKKKFKDAAEVVALIDTYLRQIEVTLERIENVDHLADCLRSTIEAHRISGLRSDVETMHREVEWRAGRLDTLKEILAEMRTMELPFNTLNQLDPPGTPPELSMETDEKGQR